MNLSGFRRHRVMHVVIVLILVFHNLSESMLHTYFRHGTQFGT